jgi:DNA-binding transcriptional MerR regulator
MLDVHALSARLGITVDQLRYLLEQIGPVLEPFRRTGQKNKILLSQEALPVLERALQLKKDGLALDSVRETITKELQSESHIHSTVNYSESPEASKTHVQNDSDIFPNDPKLLLSSALIEELRNRVRDKEQQVNDLKVERDKLLSILESKEQQILALMPARPDDSLNGVGQGSGTNGNHHDKRRPSRWRAFMYVVFGK